MAAKLLRQLGALAGILLAVSLVAFLLMNLAPGDPALAILGETATVESIAAMRARLGLDLPLSERYLDWLGNVLRGDLGQSFRANEPVLGAILGRFPVTLELLIGAQVVALGLALPVGIYTAYRARGLADRSALAAALALISTPPFLIGIILIYVFALQINLFPATGYVPLSEGVWRNLHTMLLPILTLGLFEFPLYMRLLRSDMIQTLQQNFISLARAIGLPPWRILLGHALRPSSFSLITVVGINMGRLIGGAVIVEVLFGLPGIGQLLVDGIYQREYLVVQGVVLFVGVFFVLINFAVDVLYVMLDPRVRIDHASR
ncbi:MAG: ABC transporter permease [Reyranella sp.]|nr:ABC transporter permease [Reyranella sp.]MBL6651994.1 ABC transporter permease [Reyranella sp.]